MTVHIPLTKLPSGHRSFDDNLHVLLDRKRSLMRDALLPPELDSDELAEMLNTTLERGRAMVLRQRRPSQQNHRTGMQEARTGLHENRVFCIDCVIRIGRMPPPRPLRHRSARQAKRCKMPQTSLNALGGADRQARQTRQTLHGLPPAQAVGRQADRQYGAEPPAQIWPTLLFPMVANCALSQTARGGGSGASSGGGQLVLTDALNSCSVSDVRPGARM